MPDSADRHSDNSGGATNQLDDPPALDSGADITARPQSTVLGSALRDGDLFSHNGTTWMAFCATPHLHQHTDPPAQHADPADTDIVHVAVTPLAEGDVPPARTRFVHRRQREPVDHLRVADWPHRVCEISKVTPTTVYYRPQGYSSNAWYADRARFAGEVGGVLGYDSSHEPLANEHQAGKRELR